MKIDRQRVYEKCNGHCGYCGCKIVPGQWQVDHIVSKQYHSYLKIEEDVNHISNLMPVCKECNHYKRALPVESTENLRGYRRYMETFHERLKKLPKTTKVPRTEMRIQYMQTIADKYGITIDKPWDGVFYYETLQPIEQVQQ